MYTCTFWATKRKSMLHYFNQAIPFSHSINRNFKDLPGLCEQSLLEEALETSELLEQQGSLSRNHAFCLLYDCEKKRDLRYCRRVHSIIVHSGLDAIAALAGQLIRLFTQYAVLVEANEAFNKISKPTTSTWAAIILANAKLGHGVEALELYHIMQILGKNDGYIYVGVLKACIASKAIFYGRFIHHEVSDAGFQSDIVGNVLIDMYVKCGGLEEACKVFDNLPNRDVVTYNAMITGYDLNGEGLLALKCFEKMQKEGINPDEITFSSILKACSSMKAVDHGRIVHDQIIRSSFLSDVVIGSTLVDMYAKCGKLEDAGKVFNELFHPDLVCWNAMIGGYAMHQEGFQALGCFEKMQELGVRPDRVTFLCVLKACSSMRALGWGKITHTKLIRNRFQLDVVIGSSLVDMYGKCHSLEEAQRIFDLLPTRNIILWGSMVAVYAQSGEFCLAQWCFERMQQEGIEPNVVLWGALISGYVQYGEGLLALYYFEKMQMEGTKPNKFIFSTILKACGSIGALEKGRITHERIIANGFQSDVIVGSALIDMYAKCGSLMEAAAAIHDGLPETYAVVWNTLLAAYVQHGECLLALRCYEDIQNNGMQPCEASFISLLKALTSIGAIEQGRVIHEQTIENGNQLDISVASALVDMYSKCGSLEEARNIFSSCPNRDMVLWGTIIASYVLHGESLLALECFREMQNEGMVPGQVIFSIILKACKGKELGRHIHEQVIESRFDLDVSVGITLVSMYAKCGSLGEANHVFKKLCNRDVISWNVMVTGYAHHGEALLALKCFENMQKEGIVPCETSFAAVFIACSRAGLVNEGCSYFKSMREQHGLRLTMPHCTCMVDLLGRSGCLREAEILLRTTIQTNILGWISLLSACRMHGEIEIGKLCFNQIVHLDSKCPAGYVLMSNIYADAHMHEEARKKQKYCY